MIRNKINTVKKLYDAHVFSNSLRNISKTAITNRDVINRKEMLKSLPAMDEGTVGEKAIDIDSTYRK